MSQKIHQSNKRHNQSRRLILPVLLAAGGLILILVGFLAVKGGSGSRPKVPITVSGAPSLKIDQDKVDLGEVKLGKTVEVSFQLSNAGDLPLRVLKPPYIEVVEGC